MTSYIEEARSHEDPTRAWGRPQRLATKLLALGLVLTLRPDRDVATNQKALS